MENPAIKLYNILRTKSFSEEEVASMIEDIERTVDRKFEANAERFATKKDIMEFKDMVNDNIHNLFWKMTGLILGQMGLIFLILKFVGVFDQ